MTEEEFDIHEPYRCYAFLVLMFDCKECQRYLEIQPPFDEVEGWQWFHDAADQAWRAGWYVNVAPDLSSLLCLCPDCAARQHLTPPATR